MLSEEIHSKNMQTKFRMGEKVFFIQPGLEKILVDKFNIKNKREEPPLIIDLPSGVPEAIFSKFLTIISRSYFSKSIFKLYDDVILIKLIELFDFFGFLEYALEGWLRLLSGLNSLPEFYIFLTLLKEEETMTQELLNKYYFILGKSFYSKFQGQMMYNKIKNFSKFQKNQSFHYSGDHSMTPKYSDSLWNFFVEKMAAYGPGSCWVRNTLPYIDLLLSFDGSNPQFIIQLNEQKGMAVPETLTSNNTAEIKWDVSCEELLKNKGGTSHFFLIEKMKFQLQVLYDFENECIVFYLRIIGETEKEPGQEASSKFYTAYVRESSADNPQKLIVAVLEYGNGHEKKAHLLKRTKVSPKKISHSTARLRVFIREMKIVTSLREFLRKESELYHQVKSSWKKKKPLKEELGLHSEKGSMEATIMLKAGFKPLKSQSIYGCVREFYNGTLRIKSEVVSQVISAERGENDDDECVSEHQEELIKKSSKQRIDQSLFVLNRYVLEGLGDFSLLTPENINLFSVICNQMLLDKMVRIKELYEKLSLE